MLTPIQSARFIDSTADAIRLEIADAEHRAQEAAIKHRLEGDDGIDDAIATDLAVDQLRRALAGYVAEGEDPVSVISHNLATSGHGDDPEFDAAIRKSNQQALDGLRRRLAWRVKLAA